jgi:hypothetical protein
MTINANGASSSSGATKTKENNHVGFAHIPRDLKGLLGKKYPMNPNIHAKLIRKKINFVMRITKTI